MAPVEINIPIFERNLKLFNKKGLRRSFSSILSRSNEYVAFPLLAATKKIVLEVTLDKEFALDFQNVLKAKGFTILGSTNTFHMNNLINDYNKYKEHFKDQDENIARVQKEKEELDAKNTDYLELENDDVKFYFLPYNDKIETLYDFIKSERDEILAYAKKNDITLMFNVAPFCNLLEGFFGFNFFDADQKGEVVVDYAARLTVGADFNRFVTVYQAAVLLSGIGNTKEELADSDLNVHLVVENLRYKEA